MHALGSSANTTLLFALLPLVLIDLGIVIYCIVDLFKPDRRVRGGNKIVWLLIILFVSTLGWVAYLLIGRED
ncbi:MAG TPA: PLD nuclease N-terminal domain-containing protein [Ktedonobacterales bacterium]